MHFALGRLNGFRYGYVTVITRFSHYDTLGVSQNATHERIKAKYYELSKVLLFTLSKVLLFTFLSSAEKQHFKVYLEIFYDGQSGLHNFRM